MHGLAAAETAGPRGLGFGDLLLVGASEEPGTCGAGRRPSPVPPFNRAAEECLFNRAAEECLLDRAAEECLLDRAAEECLPADEYSLPCLRTIADPKGGISQTGPRFHQRPRSKKEVTMGTEQKVAVITGASQGIGAALVKAYRDRNYRVVATARSMQAVEPMTTSSRSPATSPIGRRPSVRSPKAWPGSGASTRWSTMPASSSPSRSPSTPRPTMRRSWASTSPASSTSRSSPSPRWRSRAAAMSCRSPRAWSITRSPPYRRCWRR